MYGSPSVECTLCTHFSMHALPTSKSPPRKSSIEGRGGAREVGADEVAAALRDQYPIYQIGVGMYKGDLNGDPDMNS